MAIQFTKPAGDYDFISGAINVAGNGGVILASGTALAVISYFALNALGFSSVATGTITAIPVTIAAFGLGALVLGCIATGVIIAGIAAALGRR